MDKMFSGMHEPLKKLPEYEKILIRDIDLNLKSVDDSFDDEYIKIYEIKSKENEDKIKPAII